MLTAALPTWGFVLANTSRREPPRANSLLSHNVGMRREVCLQHPYRRMERSFVSSLLYFELVRAGARVEYQPMQKVAHAMRFRWWLRVHFRRGWETYMGRAADPAWPRIRILERMKLIEPIVLRMGLLCSDARHWFRYCRVVGVGGIRAALLFPLALTVSFAARSAEMVGMYAALIHPHAAGRILRF
jgi:hypothetical protein